MSDTAWITVCKVYPLVVVPFNHSPRLRKSEKFSVAVTSGTLCNKSCLCHQRATCFHPQHLNKMPKVVPPKSSKAPATKKGKSSWENTLYLCWRSPRCHSEILLIGIQHRSLPRMVLHPHHLGHSYSNPNPSPNSTPSQPKSIQHPHPFLIHHSLPQIQHPHRTLHCRSSWIKPPPFPRSLLQESNHSFWKSRRNDGVGPDARHTRDCSCIIGACEEPPWDYRHAGVQSIGVGLGYRRTVPSRTSLSLSYTPPLEAYLKEQARSNPLYASMVFAWSLTEVIRYSFYASSLISQPPYPLLWLRYTTFYILYPLGATSEAFLIYSTLPFSSPNPFPSWRSWVWGIWTLGDYARGAMFVIWWPALYVLYTHMMKQRRKVLGGGKTVGKSKKTQWGRHRFDWFYAEVILCFDRYTYYCFYSWFKACIYVVVTSEVTDTRFVTTEDLWCMCSLSK